MKFTATDGSTLSLDGVDLKPSFVASMVGVEGRFQASLDTSHQSYARFIATHPDICPEFNFTDELSMNGAAVWAGHGLPISYQADSIPWEPDGAGGYRRQHFHVAAWQTNLHSVHTFRYGGSVDDVLDILLSFKFVETSSGVYAVPQGTRYRLKQDATIRMRLQSLGWAEFGRHNNPELPGVPSSPGLTVPGGDLYRLGTHYDDRYAYLLVTPSGLMLLNPEESVGEIALEQTFESLAVTWVVAAGSPA